MLYVYLLKLVLLVMIFLDFANVHTRPAKMAERTPETAKSTVLASSR